MSMSRSTIQELCDFIQHKPSAVLGNKFFDSRLVLPVEVCSKGDKYETRIMAISKFRTFFMSGKTTGSLKIEKSYHVLTVKSIHVSKEDELSIQFDDGIHKKKIGIKCTSQPSSWIAIQLLTSLKHYFPDIGPQLSSTIELSPSSLSSDFPSIALNVSPRPCHSFRRTYAALCDYYDQPYREEVSWDVEKIYAINKLRDLRVEDFSHLLPRDLLPIVGVLQFSSYFTGLVCDGVRVPSDVVDVILSCVRKSHNLRKLQLRNCALPKDFVTLLASALQNNPYAILEHIDLSKNVLDDKKGFTSLATVLPRLTHLRYLNVTECQLSEKCIHQLCTGLYNGMTSCKSGGMQLTELILSSNIFKDDVSSLINLLSISTSLRVLDLTDTGMPLDKLWGALKFGGLQIEKLLVGGCSVSKKSEGVQTVKEYFSMAVNLAHISFNNTPMPSEFLKAVLLGLASNQMLQPFRIDLDATCEKGSASVLDACIGGIRCETLSLRDNNLESDLQGVLQSLTMVSCLRRLDIGGANLVQLKRSNKQSCASQVNKILLDAVKLYSEDGCLEELCLSECRLGAYLSVLLNTLGATTTLKALDISANEMGNFGARILSKALQVNVSLRSIVIDNNHIGAEGFVDLATSLKMNHTLTHIPYPVQDVFECMQRAERPRAVAALTQIQNCLYRNRTSACFEEANCKRMLSGGVQQQMEKARDETVTQVTDAINEFSTEAWPSRLGDMIDDFVDQIKREASLSIGESIARAVGEEGENGSSGEAVDVGTLSRRAEQLAVDRLSEMWTEQAKHVFSEWRWRELCEHVEAQLLSARSRSGGVSARDGASSDDRGSIGRVSAGTGSPALSSSPFTPKRSQAGHRPRSIIGDLTSSSMSSDTIGGGDVEVGVNLDVPPKPSCLSHLQKARPRKRGGASALKTINDDVMQMSRSSGADGDGSGSGGIDDVIDEVDETRSETGSGTGDEIRRTTTVAGRVAMVPDASLLAQVQLRPSTERPAYVGGANTSPRESPPLSSGSNKMTSSTLDSPPPLPQRNRIGPGGAPPPLLPPKPEPRMRLAGVASPTSPMTASATSIIAEDDENANSRRSVADMAKIFNKF